MPHRCYFCQALLNDEYFCYGCHEAVCESCDLGLADCLGHDHSVTDHRTPRRASHRKGTLTREVNNVHRPVPWPAGTQVHNVVEIRPDVWEGLTEQPDGPTRYGLVVAPTDAFTFED